MSSLKSNVVSIQTSCPLVRQTDETQNFCIWQSLTSYSSHQVHQLLRLSLDVAAAESVQWWRNWAKIRKQEMPTDRPDDSTTQQLSLWWHALHLHYLLRPLENAQKQTPLEFLDAQLHTYLEEILWTFALARLLCTGSMNNFGKAGNLQLFNKIRTGHCQHWAPRGLTRDRPFRPEKA